MDELETPIAPTESLIVDETVTASESVDWEARCQRALADYQNLVKQTAKEKIVWLASGQRSLLLEILPWYDLLCQTAEQATGSDSWLLGVRQVVKQLGESLANFGVKTLAVAVGQPFNHEQMEALQSLPTDQAEQDNTVAQVLRNGYNLGEQVLLPAQVVVWVKSVSEVTASE